MAACGRLNRSGKQLVLPASCARRVLPLQEQGPRKRQLHVLTDPLETLMALVAL